MDLTWDDTYEIAAMLSRLHRGVDPSTISHSVLRDWIMQLPGFEDDSDIATERKLETIRTIWLSLAESGGPAGPPAM